MKPILFCWFFLIAGCSIPKEDQSERCIREKVEINGNKLVYFLQTKQRFIKNDLVLKKLKVTLQLPDGTKVNRKDSILLQQQVDGSWTCVQQ